MISLGTRDSNHVRKRISCIILLIIMSAALAMCWFIWSWHDDSAEPTEQEIPMTREETELMFPILALTRVDQETEGEIREELKLNDYDRECLITEGGSYRVSGTLKGQLRIAVEEQIVHLILNDVTIASPEGPALIVESAGKVILTLEAGSHNTISDSGHFSSSQDRESCIWSECDLTINGSGTLAVNGLYKDAIHSKKVVRMLEGEIIIKCKRSGIHGADGIYVVGGNMSISSERNGLRTTKSGIDGKGNMVIAGGNHKIIAGRHAFLVGRGDLYVYNCKIYDKSMVCTYNVGGNTRIQRGCFQ